MQEGSTKVNISQIVQEESLRKGSVKRLVKVGEHEGKLATINHVELRKGMEIKPHSHADSKEFYFFLKGEGTMSVGNKQFNVVVGDFITVLSNQVHTLNNPHSSPLFFITIRIVKE